jgi:hypothetical protein
MAESTYDLDISDHCVTVCGLQHFRLILFHMAYSSKYFSSARVRIVGTAGVPYIVHKLACSTRLAFACFIWLNPTVNGILHTRRNAPQLRSLNKRIKHLAERLLSGHKFRNGTRTCRFRQTRQDLARLQFPLLRLPPRRTTEQVLELLDATLVPRRI